MICTEPELLLYTMRELAHKPTRRGPGWLSLAGTWSCYDSGMSSLPESFVEIDSCETLFLRDIREPRERSLRLLIEAGSTNPEVTTLTIAGTTITGLHRVESNDQSPLFEILWETYIAYSVRNESYVGPDAPEEVSVGLHMRLYSRSRFLEYVSQATFACPEYPGPLQHVGVRCECHLIDVVATALPSVRRIRPA
jgi:hypothetical protein